MHEITEKVVGERRTVALRDLGARVGDSKTVEEACEVAAETLSEHEKDIPFALLYLIDGDRRHRRLAGAAGIDAGSEIGPATIDLRATSERGWRKRCRTTARKS